MDDRQLAFISSNWDTTVPFRGQNSSMYDRKLVKKRKRRIAAAIVGCACTFATAALIIVSFLGRYTGTFTITLDENNVDLSLSLKKDFKDPSTVLLVNSLPQYDEKDYNYILANKNVIDTEETDYLQGLNDGNTLDYFKYTFYVKNTGGKTARYNFMVNILENSPDTKTGERYLDDVLRVAIYESDNLDSVSEGEPTVYAKRAYTPHKNENDEYTYQEYKSVSREDATEDDICYGFAEMFESKDRIATLRVKNFEPEQIKRYTIVTWLEGNDPESIGEAPQGAKLKIGVEINAYENE